METWNDNIKRAFRRSCKPVIKAEMRGMSTAFLEVRDYTAGAGDSFSVVRNGTTVFTFTEGLYFDAEDSNEQTAINIMEAIPWFTEGAYTATRHGTKIKIRGGGAGTISMAVTSTDESAWRQYRVGLPNRVVFCSDPRACNGRYGAEILDFGSIGSSFDLLERKYSLGAVDLALASAPGSMARDLVTSVPVKGQIVELFMGTDDLAEVDFEQFATMTVMDYRLEDSTIVLHLAEPLVYGAEAEASAHFVAMHPLDIIKWCWEKARLPSELWDVPSLDSANQAEISHWLTSAHSHHYWSAPPLDKAPPAGFEDSKIKEIVEEAQRILPGMIRRAATGAMEYLPFDPEASSVRHFERKDWESIEYSEMTENRFTVVEAVASESALFGDLKRPLFRIIDPALAGLTSPDESVERDAAVLKVESRFFGTPAWVRRGISDSATMLELWHGAISGISGCRHEDPNFTESQVLSAADRPNGQRLVLHTGSRVQATQRAGDSLDAGEGRTAHLLITDGGNSEIVEATFSEYPDISDPTKSPQYWYRPAAFVPSGQGGEAFVTFDNSGAAQVDLDTVEPFRNFPFATFEIAPGIGETRRITGFSPFLRMYLDAPVVATAGQRVVPRGGLHVGGTYEIGYGVLNRPIESAYFAGHAEATITRGVFRTGERTWTGKAEDGFNVGLPEPTKTAQVYDLTIAKRICEMQLERFRHGCPIAKIIVGIGNGDLQEGDFITFDDDRFLWLDHDGASQTVVWEIVGKRVAPIGDSPRVELTAAWVRSDAIPYSPLVGQVWEIPIVSPILPTPTITLDEPYTDLDGSPYADAEGRWLYPID